MSAMKEVEIKLGDVVMAVWPDDACRKWRPSVVVAIKSDEHGKLYRLMWRTTRRLYAKGLYPWDVVLTQEQSVKLGIDAAGRLDASYQRNFAHVGRVVGNISSVPGLRERIISAQIAFRTKLRR